jgi:hypothetical protein
MTIVGGSLNVSGAINASGLITATGGITSAGTITQYGPVNVSGVLGVTGPTTSKFNNTTASSSFGLSQVSAITIGSSSNPGAIQFNGTSK